MKPNFALSLSFEGIRLLHSAAGGWRLVGEVGLDSEDIAGELAMLRRTATALDPSGLRTKLLLPNGQIKYLTIDTDGMDNAARMDAARAALDGATPYAVADLAFDISADGAQTHVAAVAKETLIEAEGFAAEHRFNPICFVATPENNPYLGEPFFGPSLAAKAALKPGEEVVSDGIAVVVIGDIHAQDAHAGDEHVDAAENVEHDESPLEDHEPEKLPDLTPDDAFAVSEILDEEVVAQDEALTDDLPRHDADKQEPLDPALPAFDSRFGNDDPGKQAEAGSKDTHLDADPDAVFSHKPPEEPETTDAPPAKATGAPTIGPARTSAPAFKAPPPVAVPPRPSSGFSSRRDTELASKPQRREPLVSAPDLPRDPLVAATQAAAVSAGPTAPAIAPPAQKVAATQPAAPVAAASAAAAATGRFLSRRRAKSVTLATLTPAMATAGPPSPKSEMERMTIFGARRADVGGKPRFLGLLLTAALLVLLAGVAAWASVFLDDGLNLSRFFGDRAPRETVTAPAIDEPVVEPVVTASLEPQLTEEDTAVLDALRDPAVMPPPRELTEQELQSVYASTGIWPRAPEVPPEPAGLINLEDLYLTSIDPVSTANDAVALPTLASFATDLPLDALPSPAAAGTAFAMDSRGLVVPTAAGALSPDGITVILGRPPVVPPLTPTRFQPLPEDIGVNPALAAFRPKNRPGDLAETNERATLDGLTRSELSTFRPNLRPKSAQEEAEDSQVKPVETDEAVQVALAAPVPASPFVDATRFATEASARPDTRPRNFARIVRRAQNTPQPKAEETRVASAATVAPRAVTPKIPSKTSIARQATVKNAINLRKVNLIGVYGKPSNRRALVRLSNGRYQKVTVGDRIDGGRVSAIGDNELRYSKGGRNVILKMPRG
ncbi:MAG: hypothetical protein WBB25_04970 [Sulfitobacter sp.]